MDEQRVREIVREELAKAEVKKVATVNINIEDTAATKDIVQLFENLRKTTRQGV